MSGRSGDFQADCGRGMFPTDGGTQGKWWTWKFVMVQRSCAWAWQPSSRHRSRSDALSWSDRTSGPRRSHTVRDRRQHRARGPEQSRLDEQGQRHGQTTSTTPARTRYRPTLRTMGRRRRSWRIARATERDSQFNGGTKIDDPDWTGDTSIGDVVNSKTDLCQSYFSFDVVQTGPAGRSRHRLHRRDPLRHQR